MVLITYSALRKRATEYDPVVHRSRKVISARCKSVFPLWPSIMFAQNAVRGNVSVQGITSKFVSNTSFYNLKKREKAIFQGPLRS